MATLRLYARKRKANIIHTLTYYAMLQFHPLTCLEMSTLLNQHGIVTYKFDASF